VGDPDKLAEIRRRVSGWFAANSACTVRSVTRRIKSTTDIASVVAAVASVDTATAAWAGTSAGVPVVIV